MTTLNEAFRLFKNDVGDFYMAIRRLVESRGDDLGVYASGHIGDLLGALVNEEHYDMGLRMIFSYCVGNIFKKDCLTGLRRSDDKSTLAFPYGGEKIHYTS